MKIDKTKLVDILVEKTGMERDEIESQLTELIDRIKAAAKKGKALEIKEFGLFYFDEEGDLKFNPANEFKTEINFKYTGMEPVEIKPPRETSTPKVDSGEEEMDEDDVFGISGEEPEDEPTPDTDDSVERTFDDILSKPSESLKQMDESEVKKSGTKPKKKPTEKAKDSKEKSKKRDPIIMMIGLMIGILLLAVGYFAISEYLDAPPPSPEIVQQEQTDVPPVTAERDVVEQETQQPEEIPAEPEPETEVEDAPITVYGLMGNINATANDGFTIILHSLRNQRNADRTARELREEGYRTIVSERTVDNRTVFRVGVGQFETVQNGLEAAKTLPEPYNENHFIQRIQ